MRQCIIASACRGDGHVWQLPAPARHHHVFRTMEADGYRTWGEEESGFVTDTGRYVDRKEGAHIAVAAGQIDSLQWPPDLYSEDLW